MAKQPESKFKTQVKKVLKDDPTPSFAFAPNDAVTKGVSDLIICWNGTFISLELKIDTPVSELQAIFLGRTSRANGLAGVLRLVDARNGGCLLTWVHDPNARILLVLRDLPKELTKAVEHRYR